MRRVIYLGYYIKNLDIKLFTRFLGYVNRTHGISRFRLLCNCIISSLQYNISLLEYFQFRFYKLNVKERKTYAGTGYMYEYQLVMNPRRDRIILDDKTKFYKHYRQFIRHKIADVEEFETNSVLADSIVSNPSGKIVLKIFNGQCGRNILIKETESMESQAFVEYMKKNGYDLAEEFITQHPAFSKLSPTAVNTVRIYTQLNKVDEVEILGCRLRISVNSIVDNMAAGNIAAPVDEGTGILTGPGVYSDITKAPEYNHPVTGVPIVGFQIPFWKNTIRMVKEAALAHPQNRSVGWDIAITEKGPDLIEGNHDWCKLVWQLPVNKGLKPTLERHLSEYKSRLKQ